MIEKTDEYLLCEVQNEATLGNRKSVHVPGVRINLPSLTEKDRNNIPVSYTHLDVYKRQAVRTFTGNITVGQELMGFFVVILHGGLFLSLIHIYYP